MSILQAGAERLRIGFFGGTFDPPHLGHLAVAQAALREFALDKVLLAPAGAQPLKPSGPGAPYADRLAMVSLLCHGETGLEASDVDAPLADGKPNYTVDTLAKLHERLSSQNSQNPLEIFIIAGADAFLGLSSWREPDELLDQYEWIVVSRPGIERNDYEALRLSPLQRSHIHELRNVSVPVSATEVRARLQNGDDTSNLLSAAVRLYIQQHGLYRGRQSV